MTRNNKRFQVSTSVLGWTRDKGLWKPELILSTAVSGQTRWNLKSSGKLILNTPATDTNIIRAESKISLLIKMWGAGGGGSSCTSGAAGGCVQGIITLNPGERIVCCVGGAGQYGPDSPGVTRSGGVNGGGNSVRAGSGGGFSGIFLESRSFANAIMIAGGGGGGGHCGNGSQEGGAGGGPNGQAGVGPSEGGGGSQSGGGYGKEGSGGGGQLSGGGGAGDWGAGGGGGYYGGGGSGETPGQVSGGGGGSSYFSSRIISGQFFNGSRTTPGNSSDPERGSYGSSGSNGVIIISVV